jgi:DDE superfamily endonuclease
MMTGALTDLATDTLVVVGALFPIVNPIGNTRFSSQPILPLAPGVPARQSHDYERHGVTSLFAALDVASGVTISSCYRRHRHQEFLRFLNDIDANLPRDFEVHLVMDNYGTHKVNKVRSWMVRHPRYHVTSRRPALSRIDCIVSRAHGILKGRSTPAISRCWATLQLLMPPRPP